MRKPPSRAARDDCPEPIPSPSRDTAGTPGDRDPEQAEGMNATLVVLTNRRPFRSALGERLETRSRGGGSRCPSRRRETMRRGGIPQWRVSTHRVGRPGPSGRCAPCVSLRSSAPTVAHSAEDLAIYADTTPAALTLVLEPLCEGDLRILRPVPPARPITPTVLGMRSSTTPWRAPCSIGEPATNKGSAKRRRNPSSPRRERRSEGSDATASRSRSWHVPALER